MINAQVDISRLISKLKKVQPLTDKTMEELVNQQVKLFVSNPRDGNGMVQITPPSNKDAQGTAAKKQGEGAILRDLLGGRQASVNGGRFSGIFLVISDSLAGAAVIYNTNNVRLWVSKNGEVYGCERHLFRPNASVGEMEAHHKRYFKNGRMTQAGGRTRDIGRWKFVDKMVVGERSFKRYLKHIQKRVGILASGWNEAGKKYRSSIPAWVKRHGTKFSSVRPQRNRSGYSVTLTSRVGFDSSGTMSRARYALAYRIRAMKRRMPYLLRAAAKKAIK